MKERRFENSLYSISVQYHLSYESDIDENKVLQCLNEINKIFYVGAMLDKFPVRTNDMRGAVVIAPIFMPTFYNQINFDAVVVKFATLYENINFLESKGYIEKIEQLLEEGV